MDVDHPLRDPALLADVQRHAQLQIEGRKGGVRSGFSGRPSTRYLALEAAIKEASGRYWRSPVRG